MENSNLQNTTTEGNMSTIKKLFQEYLDQGGSPKITSFRFHVEKLMKTEIKQLCGRSGKSSSGNDWRSELMSRFKGRGSKWCFVSLEEVKETLDRFDNEGVDTEDYRKWTQRAQKAWIRFSGPRLDNGVPVAAFELRTLQSTIDQPHQLHFIPLDRLDETITLMNGTPFSYKLELDDLMKEDQSNDEVEVVLEEVEVVQEEIEVDDQMLEDLTDLENLDL